MEGRQDARHAVEGKRVPVVDAGHPGIAVAFELSIPGREHGRPNQCLRIRQIGDSSRIIVVCSRIVDNGSECTTHGRCFRALGEICKTMRMRKRREDQKK